MDTNLIQKQKYENILINTTKEVNRVLKEWKENDKPLDYNACLSLFRSYFSRFCKKEYDYIFYSKIVHNTNPVCSIENNRLINIYISDYNMTTTVFKEVIQAFNFREVKEDIINPVEVFSNHIIPNNFNNIINIKFK